jgi:Type II secretion system (T2SS), protein F
VEVGSVSHVLLGSVGLAVAGMPGAAIGALTPLVWRRIVTRPQPDPPVSLVLLLLLVELRSGMSVLAALAGVAESLPRYESLRVVARVARVSGLVAALGHADDRLRPVVNQLARAQRSGASLSGAMRRMLEAELAETKTTRIARARTLPVRLMIPVTLLMLPGLVLFLYAPSLLGMFRDLTGVLT